MKKLPYKHCYVTLKINNKIEKIFFENVTHYRNCFNPDFEEYKTVTAIAAGANDECAEKIFMLLNQSYLNSKKVINDFKKIAKENYLTKKIACVHLIFDIQKFDDESGTIQISTEAFNDKRDCFNHITKYASHTTMESFVDSLSDEMQDELFDI